MDTEMEYVPMNIKQEIETASSVITETTVNGSSTNANNNNSSQAAPDSVENKVSILCRKEYPQTNHVQDVENYLKTKNCWNFNAYALMPLPSALCDNNQFPLSHIIIMFKKIVKSLRFFSDKISEWCLAGINIFILVLQKFFHYYDFIS